MEYLLRILHPGMDIELVYLSSNIMVFLVYLVPTHMPWLIMLAYCPVQNNFKKIFGVCSTESYNLSQVLYQEHETLIQSLASQERQEESHLPLPQPSTSLQPFMNQHGLVDLGFSGPKFTQTNKRQGNRHIRERLDKGIANSKCLCFSQIQKSSMYPSTPQAMPLSF